MSKIRSESGATDVSYRDFGKYLGDEVALKFSTDARGVEDLVENISPGGHLAQGRNPISSHRVDKAGWKISESLPHEGGTLYGSNESGTEFDILAVTDGKEVTVYIYASKPKAPRG
ncbi:hypothetical protein GCM10020367_45050 [Streptomyces sannanensis]|uniref:HK97 gp10 family phage protein n=1 Tax=Streptomyces sannanensis TaxID=285536 RepID=A0ABP6SFY1_9ACTN